MFPKAASAFRADPAKLAALTEEKLEEFSFVPCATHQALSQGFSQIQGVYAYRYMGFALLNFTVQKKSVPGSAIKARVREIAEQMEQANGHWPGRKALKEVKERVVDELIARAIPSTVTYQVFIDTKSGLIIIGHTSNTLHTVIASYLYRAAEIEPTHVHLPGSKTMTSWLAEEGDNLPTELTADDSVVFEHPGETGKQVKYERANLSDHDVLENLNAGASVLALALTYDSKVSFVLKDGSLSRIKVHGVLDEKFTGQPEDKFQTELYLAASEMTGLINYLNGVA